MADSEVRQKFEAWAKLELGKYPSLYDLPDPFKTGPEDEYFEDAVSFAWAAFEAVMRAGEIARWIPVEEKLPEHHTLVWAWNALYPRAILAHLDSRGHWCGHYTLALQCEMKGPLPTADPTHWQPLPAAPQSVPSGK